MSNALNKLLCCEGHAPLDRAGPVSAGWCWEGCLTRGACPCAGGLGGLLGRLPEFTLPQLPEPLKPSRAMRSSTFEVIYLDADMRVTRGDRGELRVFLRT